MAERHADPFPRQQARTRHFRLGAPSHFVVSPDDTRVAFLRSPTGSSPANQLVVVERGGAGTGGRPGTAERVVADPAELVGRMTEQVPEAERVRRERLRETSGGITSFATDRAVSVASFALAGQVGIADLAGDDPARLIEAPEPAIDPRVDPTGRLVAWTSGRSLWVAGIDGSDARVLAGTGGGGEPGDDVSWGMADFIAAEELNRHRGFWWSPDGTSMLVARVDESPVRQHWISDPTEPGSAPRAVRYPAAGTPNADVSLWLVELDGTLRPVDWSTEVPRAEYLAAVRWTRRGDPLAVLLNRAQTEMTTVAIRADGSCRVVSRVAADPWIDVPAGAPTWFAGDQLVEVLPDVVADTYRLFLAGEPLTPPGLQVWQLLDISDDGFLVAASAEPTECGVWHVSPEGAAREIAPGPGSGDRAQSWSTATRGGGTVVLSRSTLDRASPETTWLEWEPASDGETVALAEIESRAEAPVIRPRVELLRGGDRRLRIAVQWPTGRDSGSGPLPVLMNPYGGPHSQRVVASGRAFLETQWLADQGFCVIVADGRGSPGRGPAFEHAVADHLAGPALEDQVAALEAVAERYPGELDLGRVAIAGWSFGGYLAALAVLKRPDVFHAAVAGAPVADWALYDTAYSERYLGHPDANAETYESTSLLPLAAGLSRPLLLIHGLADDNVLVAHSLRLSAALTAAGRPHCFMPLSHVTHMTPQEEIAENLLLLQVRFLRDALCLNAVPAD